MFPFQDIVSPIENSIIAWCSTYDSALQVKKLADLVDCHFILELLSKVSHFRLIDRINQ
jgi:hypothetical protein